MLRYVADYKNESGKWTRPLDCSVSLTQGEALMHAKRENDRRNAELQPGERHVWLVGVRLIDTSAIGRND